MEIVFCPSVRPCNQEISLFQGHGESVQKSGYLQEERVRVCLRAEAEARLSQSASQWMSWEFIHAETERVIICDIFLFFFFPDFVYCNIQLDFQWINLYNTSINYESCYMNEWMNDYLHHQHQHKHHPGIQTFLVCCWCDFSKWWLNGPMSVSPPHGFHVPKQHGLRR